MDDAKRQARDAAAAAQQQRAIETLDAIFAGGDLTAETLELANEFTDRQTARLRNALRPRKARARDSQPPPAD